LCYILQLKEYQQKGRDSHPNGIKTSEKKIIPQPELEEDEGSLEQNSAFDSGLKNLEHSEVCSAVQLFLAPVFMGF
jgi:hypothetical protein